MQFYRYVLLPALLFAGCGESTKQAPVQTQSATPDCQPHVRACIHQEGDLRISWQVEAEALAPETPMPFVIELSGSPEVEVVSMELTGVNMYMGRIPLPMQQESRGRYRGTLLFGACAQPRMHWRASLRLKPNSAEVSMVSGKREHANETIHFDFHAQSTRP